MEANGYCTTFVIEKKLVCSFFLKQFKKFFKCGIVFLQLARTTGDVAERHSVFFCNFTLCCSRIQLFYKMPSICKILPFCRSKKTSEKFINQFRIFYL